MPFEFSPDAPQKIAIIGAGISGMGAAHLLSKAHNVTIFESEKRLGGHARTVMAGRHGDQPVDTGFIVFNYATYPRMTKLFEVLDVPVVKSNMSFGVSADGGRVEYGLESMNAIFCQRRNLLRPKFHRMLKDIVRFNKNAETMIEGPEMTLGQLLDKMGTSDWHRNYYIMPFCGAIWSTSLEKVLDFPAEALMRFFRNHGLMNWSDAHQWYTVKGGSIEYVNRLEASLHHRNAEIRTNAPVAGVRRTSSGVEIRATGNEWEHFDNVIFACHSDQALAMLADPSDAEKQHLGAIKYQENKSVLHADPIVMPKRKAAWSSWVYTAQRQELQAPVGVTYWMNNLQDIPQNDQMFQTLNPNQPINEALIYDQNTFMHPVFDADALRAQGEIQKIQGENNTWYCGAYLRNGFHEDGYSSAVDVAEHMGMVPTWA